jgi:hypothetical protein
MKVMDPEKDKKTSFLECRVKNLSKACSTPNLALKARTRASTEAADGRASLAIDGKLGTSWKATAASNQWLQIAFPAPTTINEIKLEEDPSSSIYRYAIQCYDDKTSRWVTCFNGRHIKREFVAPIISRRTRSVRLVVMGIKKGSPAIREFGIYNDTTGQVFNDPNGMKARHLVGK